MKINLSILHVSQIDRRGGAALSAWNLFQTQRGLGHNTYMAVGQKISNDSNVFLIPNPPPIQLAVWQEKILQ